jgi:hypothetical protein
MPGSNVGNSNPLQQVTKDLGDCLFDVCGVPGQKIQYAYLTHEHLDNLPYAGDLQSFSEVHISEEVLTARKIVHLRITDQYTQSMGSSLKISKTWALSVNQSLRIPSPRPGDPNYFVEYIKAEHSGSSSFFAIRTPTFIFVSEAKGKFVEGYAAKVINETSPKYFIISSPTAYHDITQETVRDIAKLCTSKGVTPIMIVTAIAGETNLMMSEDFGRKHRRYFIPGIVILPKVVRSYLDVGYG